MDDKIVQILVEIQAIKSAVEENTRDVKYHIKRTDLLEKKTNKITYLLLLAGGTMLPTVGPGLLKFIGLL